jgi:hypothetical protein
LRVLGDSHAEVHGLAIWSAVGGALLIVAMFVFAPAFFDAEFPSFIAMLLLSVAPLLWFDALRPLSDVAGLAAASVGLAAIARSTDFATVLVPGRARMLLAGAFAAGLSAGFRSQMAVLTLPLLAFVAIRVRMSVRMRVAIVAAFGLGVLLWAVPLVALSGGPEGYLAALGSQAGEDFSGVPMLWKERSLRTAVAALLNTLVVPWDSAALAGVMLALAAAGLLAAVFERPRRALTLLLAFAPYLLFHLLFHDTTETRYALPLLIPVTALAAFTVARARPVVATACAGGLALWCALLVVPAGVAYGRTPSPIFAALSEMQLAAPLSPKPSIAMHRRIWTESRRARQWVGGLAGPAAEPRRDYEVREAAMGLLESAGEDLWFLADPRRTDLALIDSEYRRSREYRWPFHGNVYVGGARPNELDWHIYHQPGWFLTEGWALTPEIAGVTERDGLGPHRRPSVGWVRRRKEEAVMTLGGRHLGASGEPPVRIVAAIDGRPVADFTASPGFFLQFVRIPAGALVGDDAFGRLTVSALATRPGPVPRVGLEQFNLQSADVVQFGYGDGWYEPEFNPPTAKSWRWMSEAATLQVHHADTSVAIEIRGESPLRYFDEPPVVQVTAGDRTLGEMRPQSDFVMTVTATADAVAAAGGRIVLRSSAFFTPAERNGSADRRHLALRIYSVRVRAAH